MSFQDEDLIFIRVEMKRIMFQSALLVRISHEFFSYIYLAFDESFQLSSKCTDEKESAQINWLGKVYFVGITSSCEKIFVFDEHVFAIHFSKSNQSCDIGPQNDIMFY